MATVVLGTVGALIGGPIGGALGAYAGSKLDGDIFGGPGNEGPRLDELSITTSSYGQPIGRHFGKVRVAGSIIWATDLAEHRETSGGKGKPRTTSYSYSISFAVALSSRPIDDVHRIWADGNLLRGANGDLKVAGDLRIYRGHGDQPVDSLLQAATEDDLSPAYRGRAYVVFEDLDLSEYGNRIPSLSFEVSAGSGETAVQGLVEPLSGDLQVRGLVSGLGGYSHERGTIVRSLDLMSMLEPQQTRIERDALIIEALNRDTPAVLLPEPAAWDDGEFGARTGQQLERNGTPVGAVSALRYYDVDRDYQPGLQRVTGFEQDHHARQVDIPATLTSVHARRYVDRLGYRSAGRTDVLSWRIAQLPTDVQPGSLVRVPGHPGTWRVTDWEWRNGGVELELRRELPDDVSIDAADGGTAWKPADVGLAATVLRVFELPPETVGAPGRHVFAAVSALQGKWRGAGLYAVQGTDLTPLNVTVNSRATIGHLAQPLPPSRCVVFEPSSTAEVELLTPDMGLTPSTIQAIANGANRMLIGSEIVQFAQVAAVGTRTWRLTGLLRGRGGTELEAQTAHPAGTPIVLLDDRITAIPDDANSGHAYAALGTGDEEAVVSAIKGAGRSRRPLTPVHATAIPIGQGGLLLRWHRRALGAWEWRNLTDTASAEPAERYEVGVGDPVSPDWRVETSEPSCSLDAATTASLSNMFPGATLWVRQIGTQSASEPAAICKL